MTIIDKLQEAQLIHPPKWLPDNCHYLTIMGSDAYGVSSGSSDIDVYGFCIPPKHMIFPHLAGELLGFGKQIQRFEVWQEHHIKYNNKEYDFAIYSIIKFFQLCMENNPNMIDSLFTPKRCVIHTTPIGDLLRENRKLFLHKGSWLKFKGYAYSSMNKIEYKKRDNVIKLQEFENNHAIQNTVSINSLVSELTKRGIKHAKFEERFNGENFWKT